VIYKYVNGIPLFNTKYKAMKWGSKYGLTGYHTQVFNGRTGYMAGSNYKQALAAFSSVQADTEQQQQEPVQQPPQQIIIQQPQQTIIQQPQQTTPQSTPLPPSIGGGGGGGGGGGY